MACDPLPAPPASPERSLDALESFLRVIRIPRDDVKAMLTQVGTQVEAMFTGAASVDRSVHGSADLVGPGPAGVVQASLGRVAAHPSTSDLESTDLTTFEALPARVRGLYELGGTPRATVIGAGRASLLTEVLANARDGRFASAIALTITQIDGVAADVPPTPGAAFPFAVADARDRDTPDPLLSASVVAAHPGALAAVATLMRTARPDSGPADAVHRHGIMHGRDLGYGTRDHAVRVLCVLETLVAWAEPVARARVAAGRLR